MRLEKIVVADTQIIASLREQIDGAPLNKIYKFIFRQNANMRNWYAIVIARSISNAYIVNWTVKSELQ